MNWKTSRMVVCLFLLVFLSQNIFPQNSLNDTLVINELIQITDSIMSSNPKNAKGFVDSAMAIAEGLKLEDFKAKCLQRKVYYNYYLGQLSNTIDCLFELLAYRKTQKDTTEIVSCYNDIGITYVDKMEYSLSLKYLYKAMKLGKYSKDSEMLPMVFANMGYTYMLMKKYDDAHKYTSKSLDLSTKINYKEGIANANMTIGRIFITEEKLDSAKIYFERALKIFTQMKQRGRIAAIYKFLGDTESHAKRYKEAIKYYEKSANLLDKLGNTPNYIHAMSNLAYANNQLGNSRKAIVIYEKALSKVNEDDDKMAMLPLLDNVNKIYASTGNFTKAYKRLKKYSQLKDDIFNKEKSKQIEELKIEFETEQKEAEIKNLKNISEIQNESLERRQMIIFLLVGTFILLALIVYFGITRYRLKTEQNALKLEQEALKFEQRLLRSQMNPHFIFNSLSVIQGYIFKGSSQEAAGYLSSFAKLMRHILENSREEYVELEKEIETLEHYLKLQNIRNEGRITYSIIVSDEIDKENISVPPMIAQPFIENSIKHGLPESGKIKISISYTLMNNNLILSVEDDGIGINKSKEISQKSTTNHNSLAISITENRLELLSKNTDKKYNLTTIDISEKEKTKTGTRVEIEIPYREEF